MDRLIFNSVKDIDYSIIEKFAAQLKGKTVMASDNNYNGTRKIYNAMIDKYPGMFVQM